jgi:hypothetical protein
MLHFSIFSLLIGVGYYIALLILLTLLTNYPGSPLNIFLHVLVAYVIPVLLVIAFGVKSPPALWRGSIFRWLGLFVWSLVVCLVSLQLVAFGYCILGRECF